MIELTLEQAQALAQAGAPPTVMDRTTKQVYVLVPANPHMTAEAGNGSKAATGKVSQGEGGPLETPVEPWKHLVARKHPWRRQLYIKGRNMTVRQLVWSARVNKLTEEQAAANYHLPVEAIREAFAYADTNRELLDLEGSYEKYLLSQRGKPRGPQPVS
jgi:uncharacterized protein (DUF433 family)